MSKCALTKLQIFNYTITGSALLRCVSASHLCRVHWILNTFMKARKAFFFFSLSMERSNVQLMTVCTIAILALSKISRQFNYLLLKLDKYFLTITLQRPGEHMNCLTLEMCHHTQTFICPPDNFNLQHKSDTAPAEMLAVNGPRTAMSIIKK